MLNITNLSVTYGSGPQAVHALGPLSLQLERGSVCAVIGPSGCGKSTLLHALSGVIRASAGSVLLGGELVNPRRHAIGFIPQDFGLLPWRTVRQNCLLPPLIRGGDARGEAGQRLADLAKWLGIADHMDRYPGELSGGQRQRAAIARAFLMEPDLLLMDEPFSALDALTREEAQDLFLRLWGRYRTTTVFVTHSIEEAAVMGQRIAIMSHGPGMVLETVENPCFGMENPRGGGEFHKFEDWVRDIVDMAWKE